MADPARVAVDRDRRSPGGAAWTWDTPTEQTTTPLADRGPSGREATASSARCRAGFRADARGRDPRLRRLRDGPENGRSRSCGRLQGGGELEPLERAVAVVRAQQDAVASADARDPLAVLRPRARSLCSVTSLPSPQPRRSPWRRNVRVQGAPAEASPHSTDRMTVFVAWLLLLEGTPRSLHWRRSAALCRRLLSAIPTGSAHRRHRRYVPEHARVKGCFQRWK